MLTEEYTEMTIQKLVSSWLPSEREGEKHAVPGADSLVLILISQYSHQIWAGHFRLSWGTVERPLKTPAFREARTSSGSTCRWSGKGACSNQLSFQHLVLDSSELMILPGICPSSLRLFLLPQPPLNLHLHSWTGRPVFQHREELPCSHHVEGFYDIWVCDTHKCL